MISNTDFFSAVANNDSAFVNHAIINKKFNVNEPKSDGSKKTALRIAIDQRNIDLVRTLVSHNADCNTVDWVGHTPLVITIERLKIINGNLEEGRKKIEENLAILEILFKKTVIDKSIGGLTKVSALQALSKKRTLPDDVISLIVKMLEEGGSITCAALEVLGQQDRIPAEVISLLKNALNNESERVKIAALKALGRQNALPDEMIPLFKKALDDENEREKRAAFKKKFFSAVSNNDIEFVKKAILEENFNIDELSNITRQTALHMACSNRNVELAKFLILNNADCCIGDDCGTRPLRNALIWTSRKKFDEYAELVVELLKKIIEDKLANKPSYLNYRNAKANSFFVIGNKYSKYSSDIIDAIKVVSTKSTLSKDEIALLIKIAEDDDPNIKCTALIALAEHNVLPENMLPLLVEMTASDILTIKYAATIALGSIAPLPKDVIFLLIDMLDNKHWQRRNAAIKALSQQRTLPEYAIDALINMAEKKEAGTRRAALIILGCQYTLPIEATPLFEKILEDQDRDVRRAAFEALYAQIAIPPEAIPFPAEAIPIIKKALEGENESARSDAIVQLAQHNISLEDLISLLMKMIFDDNWRVRGAAIKALGNQNALPNAAILCLLKAQDDENKFVSIAANAALFLQGQTLALNGYLKLTEDRTQYTYFEKVVQESPVQTLVGDVLYWGSPSKREGKTEPPLPKDIKLKQE